MNRLVGQQCLALYLPDNINYRIIGVAGGGKTLIATYKLLLTYLQNPNKKIVFLTVNTEVNKQIKNNIKKICEFLIKEKSIKNKQHINSLISLKNNVEKIVKTVYSYFLDLIRETEKNNTITGQRIKNTDYKNLINQFNKQNNIPLPKRSTQFFIDEINWLLDMNITKKEYLTKDRIGRVGTRLEKGKEREIIYMLFEFYQKNILDKNHRFTMNNIYNYVIKNLNIKKENQIDFLIVDEFQDLSAAMLFALQKCIRPQQEGGHILFLGDDAQNIFGKKIPWNKFNLEGIKGHILRLDHVYRNTIEIYEIAKKILTHPLFNYSKDTKIQNKPLISKIHGNKPQIINCSTEDDCINPINNFFNQYSNRKNAIIFLDTELCRKFKEKGNFKNIKLITTRRVKGLEFDNVVIPFINKYNDDYSVNGDRDKNEIISEHLKKCYVAVTRAKKNLMLIKQEEN